MSRRVQAAALRAARGPLASLWMASAPALRWACQDEARRRALERIFRVVGEGLVLAAGGQRQIEPAAVAAEWARVLAALGLAPARAGCEVCFSRCSLDLGPGDGATCDTAMAINDQIITRLGGRMSIGERLTDPGARRCQVTITAPPPRERPVWCDAATARGHFDAAAPFYDFIMGYFEIPANRRSLADLAIAPGGTALELGAGTGLGLAALLAVLPPPARVIAVDSSAGMIARASARIARRGEGARVRFIHGQAERLPLPDRSVDLVWSSFLLDLHSPARRRQILTEAARVARPAAPARFAVMDAVPERLYDRALSRLYEAGYGHWNPLWMRLFRGYAPHCRPIDLGPDLEATGWRVRDKRRARVGLFPVAIWQATAA